MAPGKNPAISSIKNLNRKKQNCSLIENKHQSGKAKEYSKNALFNSDRKQNLDEINELSIWEISAALKITRVNSFFRSFYAKQTGKVFRSNSAIKKVLFGNQQEQKTFNEIVNSCFLGEHIKQEISLFGCIHEVELKQILLENDAKGVVCFMKNVGEKRQQLLENAYQNERWKIAVEGNEYGMWDWDIKKNKLYFSSSCYKLLGYDESDGIDGQVEDWCARIHPDDLPKSGGNLLNIIGGMSDSFKTEIRIRCKNGEYKWILDQGKAYGRDDNGFPTNIIGLMKDISESKSAEQRLQDQLNRLEKFAHLTSHSLRLPVASILGLTSLVEEIDNKEELIKVAQYLKSSAMALDLVIREMNDALTEHNHERVKNIDSFLTRPKLMKSKRA